MRKTGSKKPALVTYKIKLMKIFLINIDTHKEENGDWSWFQVELSPGKLEYDDIVTKLILSKYDSDKISSIVNNYLSDSTSPDYRAEYSIMQSWRNRAKEIAKEAIQYAIDNGLWENESEENS